MEHNPIHEALYRPQNFGSEMVQFAASDFREVFGVDPQIGRKYSASQTSAWANKYQPDFVVLTCHNDTYFGTWRLPDEALPTAQFMSGFYITRFDGGAE